MSEPKNGPWYLGIDLGTGSCKCVAIDAQARVVGFGSSDYQRKSLDAARSEQHPESIWAAAVDAVRQAVARNQLDPAQCTGVSLGAAMHGLMAVDASGQPLTGVITWADGRAVDQVERADRQYNLAELYRRTGCPPHWLYPLYKLLWLREEQPDEFRRAALFLSAKEFLLKRMTGAYCMDLTNAGGSGMLDVHTLQWDPAALQLASVELHQLPPLGLPTDQVGELLPEPAELLGLPARTPVFLGSADSTNSSIGAGGVLPQQATCMIGTSGALRVVTHQPMIDPTGRCWCYPVDGKHWLVGGAINNGGLALSWLRDLFNHALPGIQQTDYLSFAQLVDLAEQVGTGAGGVFCLPLFAGERSPRWNLHARGLFFGLSAEHHAGHVARAVLEGVAFRMRSLEDMLTQAGVEISQMRASGGFMRSETWMRIVTNVMNRDLVAPEWSETSSLGAALWALVASHGDTNLDLLAGRVPVRAIYSPDPVEAGIYEKMAGIYRRLYDAVEGSFIEVSLFQQELRG